MKQNDNDQSKAPTRRTVSAVCHASCQRLLARLESARAAIVSEFRERVQEHEHLLDLAMNEAEALAWQTGFPQLLFPTLATEKACAVASWHARQEFLRRPGLLSALTA